MIWAARMARGPYRQIPKTFNQIKVMNVALSRCSANFEKISERPRHSEIGVVLWMEGDANRCGSLDHKFHFEGRFQ